LPAQDCVRMLLNGSERLWDPSRCIPLGPFHRGHCVIVDVYNQTVKGLLYFRLVGLKFRGKDNLNFAAFRLETQSSARRRRFLPRCTPFEAPDASCRSILCWWPKVKRKSARRIFRRLCAVRRCWPRCANATEFTCPLPSRT